MKRFILAIKKIVLADGVSVEVPTVCRRRQKTNLLHLIVAFSSPLSFADFAKCYFLRTDEKHNS